MTMRGGDLHAEGQAVPDQEEREGQVTWWARLRSLVGGRASLDELVEAHCRDVFKHSGWDNRIVHGVMVPGMSEDHKDYWRTNYRAAIAAEMMRSEGQ